MQCTKTTTIGQPCKALSRRGDCGQHVLGVAPARARTVNQPVFDAATICPDPFASLPAARPPASQPESVTTNADGVTADPMTTVATDTNDRAAGTLFINQGGLVACTDHGGQYLASTAARRTFADGQTSHTPLDNWEVVGPETAAEHGLVCETCAQQGGRR